MALATQFTLFQTALGRCAIAWNERGLVGVQLPEAADTDTRGRVLKRFAGAQEARPTGAVRQATQAIAELLSGQPRDLTSIALDMEGVPAFHRRVYQAARLIPPGQTLSYGDIARRVGSPGSARAVGQALGRNPFAIIVPCHRVLAAGGKVGGFSANGGVTTKLRMLAIEGAQAAPAGAKAASAKQSSAKQSSAKRSRARQQELSFTDGGTLEFDPRLAIAHIRKVEPALGRVIDAVGSFDLRVDPAHSLFSALARAIVYQQLSGKAAATIFGRVKALFPKARVLGPQHILRATDQQLRGAGLSRSKQLSLRDLAQRTAAGQLPTLAQIQRMDDEAIIERLIEVRGIGRWTVQMLLIFRLGRPDVLAVDDYGVRKGYSIAFGKRTLPAPTDLEERGARWAPYRTVASWYFWRAVGLAQQGWKPKR
jgi:methylated-DNA-[protein]-cysteine S-methyltransferase